MKRIAIVLPGRGSYTEASMRQLPADDPYVVRADELRAGYGLAKLTELDTAERFSAGTHLRPANVSLLIWITSMIDARAAMESNRVVCVAGNSMGWYTALAVAGALDFDDGFRLVQEMSLLQEGLRGGGQCIYPVVDEEWRTDPARRAAVDAAVESSNGQAFHSIDLGGYAVLAGSDVGMAHLMRELPPVQVGKARYPFKLVQHGPYHTPLVAEVSEEARARLARLTWRRPRVPMIDGRGVRFTPWSTDTRALRDYTLRAQVIEPYDFRASVRVALREYAPDAVWLPGPGNTLGGVCGQILIQERWRNIGSRADFEVAQAESDAPIVSMRR